MTAGVRTLSSRLHRLSIGLLIGLLVAAMFPVTAEAALNGYLSVNEFATPLSGPFDIITGPDQKLWYTLANGDLIAQADPATGATLNQYSWPGCDPTGITIGPDQNLWVACFLSDQILRVTTAGVITPYPLPVTARTTAAGGDSPEFLTSGPDGFLWFTQVNSGYVSKMNVSTGSLYEYPLAAGPCTPTSTVCAAPRDITVGADGNLWFTEEVANVIGRITTSGSITEYAVPTGSSSPFGITSGSDGNLYFTEIDGGNIGRITLGGGIAEFPIPTFNSQPRLIKVGPDGNLWFAEANVDKIGSLTADGGFQDTAVLAGSHPIGVATGPDGNVWFTERNGNQIGRIGARHNALTFDKTGIGFGQVAPNATTASQRVTMKNNGPDALPAFTPFLFNPGASGPSGAFNIAATTCGAGSIASGSTCYADVTFTATSVPGNAVGTLRFETSFTGGFLAQDKQDKDILLSATVVGAACASTAISTDLASPQSVGALVTLSATSAGCPDAGPLYRFWLRDTNAVWHIVKDFSTTTSFVWDTSSYAPGTYLTGVWVRDANSTNTYDAYAFGTFTLGLPSCSSTNLSSDVASPQAVGATVTFTASSIGCPNPLYQWWVRDAAGNWSIAVPFAAGNTFAWNTSALTEGTYQIGVWAKQKFSANSYDAFAFVTYTLTVTHCGTVGLSTNVTSPQTGGSTVNLTATATGCSAPTYRFYVRDTAGTWHVVQDFSTTATYSWGPASPVSTSNPGTYLLGVWARQPGSANTYDAFFFVTFSLTSGATCTVNIAADKTSPQTQGTTVNWTATANTCPGTPLKYQFWVNPPGGTWTIAQPFATTNTFAWTGSAPGTYQIGVWVKQASSSASYDNFAFTTFTLNPTSPAQVCSSVGVTPSVASPQMVGTSVTFTAVANGCSAPQFQWWVRDTAANWAITQDFAHSNPSFVWTTTGLPAGTYLVGVWARQTGSTASYEAYSFITYTLTVPAGQKCSSTNLSPSVPSPQAPGTPITFTASALGCSTPDFQFFVTPPAGSFGVAQPFGSANTFVWNTTGLAPGPYQIGVWARQHGSSASYEAFAFITFQLAYTACTTLTMTASPSQVIHGNGVGPFTVTASASGCPNAVYQFYVRTPGGGYVMQQPYSPTATFGYPPTPAPGPTPVYTPGGYSVLVLARDAASPAAFDSFAVTDFLFDP